VRAPQQFFHALKKAFRMAPGQRPAIFRQDFFSVACGKG
jgi:hypothetical protein